MCGGWWSSVFWGDWTYVGELGGDWAGESEGVED